MNFYYLKFSSASLDSATESSSGPGLRIRSFGTDPTGKSKNVCRFYLDGFYLRYAYATGASKYRYRIQKSYSKKKNAKRNEYKRFLESIGKLIKLYWSWKRFFFYWLAPPTLVLSDSSQRSSKWIPVPPVKLTFSGSESMKIMDLVLFPWFIPFLDI